MNIQYRGAGRTSLYSRAYRVLRLLQSSATLEIVRRCAFRCEHWLRKGSVTQRPYQEPGPSLSEADLAARNAFFQVLLHQDDVARSQEAEADRILAACVVWYGKFLECRFRGAWTTVTREALRNLDPRCNVPQPGEIGTVYGFMSVVARLLLEVGHRGLAISDISDQAANIRLFKDQKDAERAIPNQLVFAAVGWLSESPGSFSYLAKSNASFLVAMLYDPEPIQRPGQLKVRQVIGSMPRPRARTRPGRTFIRYVQEGFDGFDQPLFVYLRKFGHLIPEIGVIPKVNELIIVSHVCFAMLDKVADVKIEWVNSLSLHLEFDNVRRVLKIFRFPSFCVLMYRDQTSISK